MSSHETPDRARGSEVDRDGEQPRQSPARDGGGEVVSYLGDGGDWDERSSSSVRSGKRGSSKNHEEEFWRKLSTRPLEEGVSTL